ncbi:uncharacterized protein PAC_00965 [Phialocephala subalpina]|uniref:Glycosyl hydrolase family 95 N-terminal domain-containing protein n=1 Tax=Phialocephala subalpina TaxID=576137 RepID=A0A1L7WE77_9HELO|nr:uncharacterized protein PAC_00965 [Phialocephala subalpina]
MVGPLRLWYKDPASKWPDALPIGNGRLGAMMFVSPSARSTSLFPHSKNKVTNYQRHLDLSDAVTGVFYELDGVCYSRESFSSNPDNVIATRFSASHPSMISFAMRLFRGLDTNVYMDSIEVIGTTLVMRAQTRGNGGIECIGETIVVRNADMAYIMLAAETTFRHNNPEAVCLRLVKEAIHLGYDRLRTRHVEDYRSFFSRVELRIGSEDSQNLAASKSTSERMALARNGVTDLGLIALYYQYGRYLLISSSRPGLKALSATLQGIWNDNMSPPWGSKFTININTEMNYWLAETCNLSECHEPLFSHMKRLQKNGEETARKMYDCSGWVAHHNTDIWADSAPQDRWIPATLWPMGGAWLSTHIWHHFEFSGDKAFLAEAYAVLRGSVEFFLNFPVEKDGYMVTNPSLSLENVYRLPNGEQVSGNFLAAAEVLGKEEDTVLRNRWLEDYEAAMHVREILRTSTHDSLLDDHPPFQIDGNFGATAGITEILVQSHGGEIALLPALPPSWSEGSVKGLCARGGFVLDMTWSSGFLSGAVIESRLGNVCVLKAQRGFSVDDRGKVVVGPVSANVATSF